MPPGNKFKILSRILDSCYSLVIALVDCFIGVPQSLLLSR